MKNDNEWIKIRIKLPPKIVAKMEAMARESGITPQALIHKLTIEAQGVKTEGTLWWEMYKEQLEAAERDAKLPVKKKV